MNPVIHRFWWNLHKRISDRKVFSILRTILVGTLFKKGARILLDAVR